VHYQFPSVVVPVVVALQVVAQQLFSGVVSVFLAVVGNQAVGGGCTVQQEMVWKSGAAFTKCFYNSYTIFLRFFYDYSLRAFTVFSARNPSQPQQGKSFPEFGMHQILLQFFHKIAIESLFPH
jgi:hypothetical protein